MALLDFLKRKKETEKSKTNKKAEKKPVKTSVAPVEKKEKKAEPTPAKPQKARRTAGFSYDIVKKPHISEKATLLSEKNQYVFDVYQNANKTEVKKSVEGIYGVDVLSVNMIKIPAKKRRLGKTQGFKKAFTKAVVKIRDGQKIEIL